MVDVISFMKDYWLVIIIIAWFMFYSYRVNIKWLPKYKLWDIVLTCNKENIYTQEVIIWSYRPWDQTYWLYVLSSWSVWIDIYVKTEEDIIRKIWVTNMPVNIESKKVLSFLKNEDYNHMIKNEIYDK